jgi:hypothetical protein
MFRTRLPYKTENPEIINKSQGLAEESDGKPEACAKRALAAANEGVSC